MKKLHLIIIGMLLVCVMGLYAQEEETSSPNLRSIINNTGDVGTPSGSFSVTPTGGASYSIAIEAPKGITGAEPQVAVTYNSQAGNGIAGWGCNISGISVITRGIRDIYHDTKAAGMTHEMDDVFYLDGQRLMEKERVAGRDTAVYYLENDPYTRIVLHGLSYSSQWNTWFSVESPDGMKYVYGRLTSSQDYYSYGIGPRTNAWYISEAETATGNPIYYSYTTDNYCLYPSQIQYGTVRAHYIKFEYENRPDTTHFVLEDKHGMMTKRLKYVTSSSSLDNNEHKYRRYTLSYNDTGDGTATRFSRLTSVTLENDSDEVMNPIQLDWLYLSSYGCAKSTPSFSPSIYTQGARQEDMSFSAADLNGDGLTDIVLKAKQYVGNTELGQFIRVYHAQAEAGGTPSFQQAHYMFLGDDITAGAEYWSSVYTAPVGMDVDGDGINELLVPKLNLFGGDNYLTFYIFKQGSEIAGINCRNLHTTNASKVLWSVADFNNDGQGEFIVLEKEKEGTNLYYASITGINEGDTCQQQFKLSLPQEPRHVLTADMDCDGLSDIIAFYNGGYAVFLNDGTWIDNFSNNNPLLNIAITPTPNLYTNSLDPAHVWQGDFNGDGISDFLVGVYSTGNLYFELGNGDGTLTKKTAASTEIHEQSTTPEDNDKMNCQVLDLDGDGKSDVVITKSMYDDDDFLKTHTYWFLSDGEKLIQLAHATSDREEDGLASHYVSGDFNGDGIAEVASLSYDCYSSTNSNVEPVFRIYRNANYNLAKGKVSTITNGFGTQTLISYKSMADNDVYTRGNNTLSFPVVHVTPAIPVVSSVTAGNGAAGNATTNYSYEGMKVHVQGKGLIGMTSTTTKNVQTGQKVEARVSAWHPVSFQPTTIITTDSLEQAASSKVQSDLLVNYSGTMSYVLSTRNVSLYDYDGNHTTENYLFQPLYNKVVRHDIYTNDNKSVRTWYTYGLYGRQYLPTEVEKWQKSGSNPWDITTTAYAYNNKGQVTSETRNAGTSLALTTSYTYDTVGNVLSETTTGNDIESVTKTYQYDATRRFITRSVERGYIITEYTYDKWGNMQTETDKTRSACPMITYYAYDNWGRLISSTSPIGLTTNYSRGWGYTAAKRYYTLEEPTAQPWVKTWYDETGREVLTESIGLKGVSISEQTTYTSKGQVQGKTSTEGNRTVTESYTYDARGRIHNSQVTPGASISYAYGNRSVTTTTNGRQYTKTYDSWGNIIQATDPVSSVTYVYGSNGKPSSVTSEGATVTMQYDAAGNQTQLVDPDAGTMTYTYDALGRIKTQTDGNDIVTTNTYNSLGQLTQTMIGTIPTTYTYGQGTSNNGLLLSMSRDGFTESYQYDNYGRVTQETRDYGYNIIRTKTYTYNQLGQVSTRTFPNQLSVSYQYDSYGNLDKILSGTNTLYQVQSYSGTSMTEKLGSNMTRTSTFDNLGLVLSSGTTLSGSNTTIAPQQYTYNYSTGNLTTRSVNGANTESFTYDNLDRLVKVSVNGIETESYSYSANGNITSKSHTGAYSYEGTKPHAVTTITNNNGNVPVTSGDMELTYDETGNINMIEDYENIRGTSYFTGPDLQRWESGDFLYFGDYEERYDNVSFTYLDGGLLCITRPYNGNTFYYIHTDNLGSIVEVVDGNGQSVFRASYDPWGLQTVSTNSIYLHRGYTGHEMLNSFGLIHMNGRLYDPINARFLSPDNYVQEPWNSQNFNRYSYCLNNPLKFTDPSGEWFGIDDLVASAIGGIINLGSNLLQGNVHSFWQGLSLFGVGALAGESALYTGGAAPYVSSFITSVGNDMVNQGFSNGFRNIDYTQVMMNAGMSLMAATASQYIDDALGGGISDFITSFKIKSPVLNNILEQSSKGIISGAIMNGGLVAANGGNAQESWSAVLRGAGTGFVMGAVCGFTEGYLNAYHEGRNPWTGKLNSYKKGSIGVKAAMEEFIQGGGRVLATEVTVEVDGLRNRFDFVGEKNGVLYLYEVKYGPKAHLTNNQKINIPKLQNKQATFIPIGKNAMKVKDFIECAKSRTPFSGLFDVTVRWF